MRSFLGGRGRNPSPLANESLYALTCSRLLFLSNNINLSVAFTFFLSCSQHVLILQSAQGDFVMVGSSKYWLMNMGNSNLSRAGMSYRELLPHALFRVAGMREITGFLKGNKARKVKFFLE